MSPNIENPNNRSPHYSTATKIIQELAALTVLSVQLSVGTMASYNHAITLLLQAYSE
jgi:hypothetical protein